MPRTTSYQETQLYVWPWHSFREWKAISQAAEKSHRMLSAGGMNTRHEWRNMHASCSTTGTWVLCWQVIRNVANPLNQDAN